MSKENHERQSTKVLAPTNYYQRLLRLLIAGLRARLSYAALANALTRDGIKTPRGRDWCDSHVKAALKSLRHPDRYPSRLHDTLVEMLSYRQLTLEEASLLCQLRKI